MQKASTRRRKANGVFIRVALSYLWLYLRSKIAGKAYWDNRIKGANRKNAERIRDVMLELQGLFIKFGQLISILSNILPEEFRAPLESLQDRVPPHSFDLMAKTIEKELGKAPKDIYTSIDPIPIAAASIGQVHRATIGEKEVIIKIQHPQIEELVFVDLSIIKKIVGLVARFMKIKGIEHLYQQIEQMIQEELNYLQEAQSMKLIKNNVKSETGIYIPKVYEEFSSQRVLTIEYCEGTKISNLQQLEDWGLDFQELTETLIKSYCQMILVDGFYHADPHPGNVLVNQEGQIILLDFGAVALLSKEMKEGIPLLIECVIKQDAEGMVKVLRKLGFISHGEDAAKIAELLIDSIQDFIHNELQLNSLNIENVTPEQMRKAFQLINIKEMTKIMQIPKDWVLLNRAVVLVSGVAYLLTPNWNPVEVVQPYIKRKLIDKNGGVVQVLLSTIKTQLNILLAVPLELQKALQKINKGKLAVEVKTLENGLKNIQYIGQQLIWLITFIAAICLYLNLENTFIYPNLFVFSQVIIGVSFAGFCWSFWRSWN